jgi:hypothetical protein
MLACTYFRQENIVKNLSSIVQRKSLFCQIIMTDILLFYALHLQIALAAKERQREKVIDTLFLSTKPCLRNVVS